MTWIFLTSLSPSTLGFWIRVLQLVALVIQLGFLNMSDSLNVPKIVLKWKASGFMYFLRFETGSFRISFQDFWEFLFVV